MKKLYLKIIVLCTLLLFTFSLLCACSNEEQNTFRTDFATNTSKSLQSTVGVIEQEPILQNIGYQFDGWFLDSDFSGERISFPYTPEQDNTLYAKWTLVDSKSVVIELFKARYSDPNTESWQTVTLKNGVYTHTRNVAFDGSQFQFEYNTKTDMFVIYGYFALKLSATYTAMCATNLTFKWGELDSGISILNEVSYFKNTSRIHANIFSIDVISHDNTTATINFTENSNNSYATLKALYNIKSDEETEKMVLQDTFNRSIEYANDFLYETKIKI